MQDYYEREFRAYHRLTFKIDPSSFLTPLQVRLHPEDTVLDIGCGSGRDLLWFRRKGYTVIGFERSHGLADLARQNAACTVIEGDFKTYDFSRPAFDAILLVGTLVYIKHDKLHSILQRIAVGLKEHGKILITLKEGEGKATGTCGRHFYLWKDRSLRKIFLSLDFQVLDLFRQVSPIRDEDVWLGYVLEKRRTGLNKTTGK